MPLVSDGAACADHGLSCWCPTGLYPETHIPSVNTCAPNWHPQSGEGPSWKATQRKNKDSCSVWLMFSQTESDSVCCVSPLLLVTVQGRLWTCAVGPVLILLMTVWNQIYVIPHETPAWFLQVRLGGAFKGLFQGDCLFIWPVLLN